MDGEEESSEVNSPPIEEPKKHVTVKDEPEVFTFSPDTLQVEKQEKPRPLLTLDASLEDLTEDEVANVIEETAEILRSCEEKVMYQKLNIAKLGFIVMKISESLQDYETYLKLLRKFSLIGDNVTSQYYVDVCETLPSFGDYLSVLEDSSAEEIGMKKQDLVYIVKEIQENTFAGGVFLKSFRVLNKDVYKFVSKRKQAIEQIEMKVGTWITLQNSLLSQLDHLKERLYRLSVHLDILKSGETRIKLSSDFSADSVAGNNTLTHILGETTASYEMSNFKGDEEISKSPGHKPVSCRRSTIFSDFDKLTFDQTSMSPGNGCLEFEESFSSMS